MEEEEDLAMIDPVLEREVWLLDDYVDSARHLSLLLLLHLVLPMGYVNGDSVEMRKGLEEPDEVEVVGCEYGREGGRGEE